MKMWAIWHTSNTSDDDEEEGEEEEERVGGVVVLGGGVDEQANVVIVTPKTPFSFFITPSNLSHFITVGVSVTQ